MYDLKPSFSYQKTNQTTKIDRMQDEGHNRKLNVLKSLFFPYKQDAMRDNKNAVKINFQLNSFCPHPPRNKKKHNEWHKGGNESSCNIS